MSQSVIQLSEAPIGQGRERTCYVHPDDNSKLIKISTGEIQTQTKRELAFYRQLEKRKDLDYSHLPRFYGLQQTNLGTGIVVDLIRDYDGNVSKSLRWHILQGTPMTEFEGRLDELKHYLLHNRIIINHDLATENLLIRRETEEKSRLVVIDGLGDVVIAPWLNHLPFHARAKIERRWQRFIKKLYSYPRVRAALEKQN